MYMQRILFILIACLLLCGTQANAQRDLSGQTGLQLTTGSVNRFLSWKSGGECHYFTSLALTRTNRNHTHWFFGVDYLQKDYTYEGEVIPKAQFTGEIGYFIPVLSDRGRNVCLRVGLSALGGYEVVNWSESLLHDGSRLTNKDCFLYGGGLTAAFETYLSDRLVLLMQVKQRALFGTAAGNFHTEVGLGLRIIIN
ncbi:conjugal transfer protein TraO [Bacteroides reticulotermitis]|uniref:conjugal transfer protein TraO n=1 Tax=Bacteroides reticulotermitis TaxID=1133319 RepID=UPI003A841B57